MSIVEMETLSNNELKKRVTSLISLEEWSDSCRACGIPSLLHKDGPCMRQEREPPDVVMKVWTEFKRRVKPILATLKEDYRKEAGQSVLLDGINPLITQISDQNVYNKNKHYMTLPANSKFGICYTPCNITCITMQL